MGKKVNLNSVVALKTECDEHLPAVMGKFDYVQSFKMADLKLVIGYLAVIVAGGLYWLEKKYKNDFHNQEYVNYTKLLVVLFFSLDFGWWGFSKFVEKDVKYVGVKGSKKVTISTTIKSKTEPVYTVEVSINKKHVQGTVDLTKVFDSNGYLQLGELTSKIGEVVKRIDKDE